MDIRGNTGYVDPMMREGGHQKCQIMPTGEATMNSFLAFLLIICLMIGFWLSKNTWSKLFLVIPLGVLVPAFYGTATNCGLGFVTEFFAEGVCKGGNSPREVLAGVYVISFVPVVVFAVLAKLGRDWAQKNKGA